MLRFYDPLDFSLGGSYANRQAEREMAASKAEALFLSHLSPAQKFTWTGWGFVYVRGSDHRQYAIFDGRWIAVIEARIATRLLGAHLDADSSGPFIPRGDFLLTQKLMIETNMRKVKRMACKGSPHHIRAEIRDGLLLLHPFKFRREIEEDLERIFAPRPGRLRRLTIYG